MKDAVVIERRYEFLVEPSVLEQYVEDGFVILNVKGAHGIDYNFMIIELYYSDS